MIDEKTPLVDIACEIIRETAHAIEIDDGETRCWLPCSQIEIGDICIALGTVITMPEWLAEDRGLI